MNILLTLLSIISFLCLGFVSTNTNITSTIFLRDPDTLVSSKSIFRLGFFNPINSTKRYVGIWYNLRKFDIEDVVWVANRNNPLNDSSGVLRISKDGNLQLSDGQNTTYWSSNVSHVANSSSVAKLLDTGNLVLLPTTSGMIIWQSFEHLTNSLLPQTRVLVDITLHNGMGLTPILRSWKSASDPSDGRFTIALIPSPITQFILLKDDEIYWRTGPWNGSHFLGLPGPSETFRIVYNQLEHTLDMLYFVANESSQEYYVLNYDGVVLLKMWDYDSQQWQIGFSSFETECEFYGKCGPFGQCNPGDSPICSCLNGFKPMNIDEWNTGNWTDGCVRKSQLQCGNTGTKADGFKMLPHVKVPNYITLIPENDQYDCRRKCLDLCSCVAYAYPDGIGCMIWTDKLIDIQLMFEGGADLFIRLAHSELGEPTNMKTIIAVIVTISTTTFVVFIYCLWSWIHRRYVKKSTNKETQVAFDSEIDKSEFKDLTMFKFQELEVATNGFSDLHKLGRGGFGPVYKGKKENGQEIAVKRLSRASGQGLQEFMNEVLVISKLQHKNLVRLLGCCVEGEEKLLVYEYMSNKSLDALLFDSHQQKQLDWKKRFNIINGICRGLLYLHRDSRLKIIHRDLKASNILLDEELNPKISDFGMARIFEAKQDQDNTLRVVGTYGYMSPEYAMEGRFSEKSDIFSLGVLLLEIVSGRKNASFLIDESLSLLTYAWKLWNENEIVSLIDSTLFDPCFNEEILKCIQLGLLCVQEYPEDRPNVSELVSMLDVNDIKDLPLPTQPGFTFRKHNSPDDVFQSSQEYYGTVNIVSLTAFSGR